MAVDWLHKLGRQLPGVSCQVVCAARAADEDKGFEPKITRNTSHVMDDTEQRAKPAGLCHKPMPCSIRILLRAATNEGSTFCDDGSALYLTLLLFYS